MPAISKQRLPRLNRKNASDFFNHSTSTGIVILVFTAFALIWANSPLLSYYELFLHYPIAFRFSNVDIACTFEHVVNDGLMVLFFLIVGLEIKREVLLGELSTIKKALLPLIAAVMGVIGPALIFISFTAGTSSARGWGVPVATDIAFALGVLALLGNRIPSGLRVFLAALAIVDDLIAVLIIAVSYSAGLNALMLAAAGICTLILIIGNRRRITSIWFYSVLGIALWVLILCSGIHATIAGVILAMCIPAKSYSSESSAVNAAEITSPLHRIEHGLGVYVSFCIIPLFALVNAGVTINPNLIASLASPVSLGIILGLFVGKQIGITAAVWVSVKIGFAKLPAGVSMRHMYGMSLLCGIGFTMALFVGHLAFADPHDLAVVKLSVIFGSVISAVAGTAVLRSAPTPHHLAPKF